MNCHTWGGTGHPMLYNEYYTTHNMIDITLNAQQWSNLSRLLHECKYRAEDSILSCTVKTEDIQELIEVVVL